MTEEEAEQATIDNIRILHPTGVLETRNRGALRVGYSGDLPTDYVEDGRLMGIHGEVRARVARMLGLDVSAIQMAFADMLPALQAGEIDLPGLGTAWTEERAANFRLTQPFQYFFFGVAAREMTGPVDLPELRGKLVAGLAGSFNCMEVMTCLGEERAIMLATLPEIVDALVGGKVEAAIYDFPNIKIALDRHPNGDGYQVVPLRFNEAYPLTTGRWANHFLFGWKATRLQAAAELALDFLKTSGRLAEIYAGYGFKSERMLSLRV